MLCQTVRVAVWTGCAQRLRRFRDWPSIAVQPRCRSSLHTRKDAAREIEAILVADGGIPLLASSRRARAGRPGILVRSPAATVLEAIPLILGAGWLAFLAVTLVTLRP